MRESGSCHRPAIPFAGFLWKESTRPLLDEIVRRLKDQGIEVPVGESYGVGRSRIQSVRFLGTGPAEPVMGEGKNRRLNSSVVLGVSGNRLIQIDVTPFVKEQWESAGIDRVDYVLLTHAHEDASCGLDNLLKLQPDDPPVVYAEEATKSTALENHKTAEGFQWKEFREGESFQLEGMDITPIRVKHALVSEEDFPTVALRFNDDLVYAEDVLEVPEESNERLAGADVYILDGAFYFEAESVIGHWRLEEALEHLKGWKPRVTYLIQMGRTWPDHNDGEGQVQERWGATMDQESQIFLSYDGLELDWSELQEQKALPPDEQGLIEPGGDTRSERAWNFWEENWWRRLGAISGKQPFILHEHWRGLPEGEKDFSREKLYEEAKHSVHHDLRLRVSPQLAWWGMTLFSGTAESNWPTPKVFKLDEETLQVWPKFVTPGPGINEWLTLAKDGPVLSGPGDVGSTEDKWAKFWSIDSGTYEMGVANRGFIEVFLNGKEMKGRYTFQRAETEDRKFWILKKPDDQKPYAETHDLEKTKERLRADDPPHEYLIWSDGSLWDLKADRKVEPPKKLET